MKKKNYTVTLNGQTFTRKSHRDYESAGGCFHKVTGKLHYGVSFAGPGRTPNVCTPGAKNMPDYEIIIAKVEVN